MSTVQEIETAISSLSVNDRWNLLNRLHDDLWEKWDDQIEADCESGKFDELLLLLEAEISEGNLKSLDEVIND